MKPYLQPYDTANPGVCLTRVDIPTALDWDALVVKPLETMPAQAASYIPVILATVYVVVFGREKACVRALMGGESFG